jgi:hypothetical protein
VAPPIVDTVEDEPITRAVDAAFEAVETITDVPAATQPDLPPSGPNDETQEISNEL